MQPKCAIDVFVAAQNLTPQGGGPKIINTNLVSAVRESALAADLHRAMKVAKANRVAANKLPTLTKAELAEKLFEQVGLNKREAKDLGRDLLR